MRVDLRVERERRGLTLDQVADRARIPRHYLAALETGDLQDLPKGPFLQSYRRQYLAFLGLPPGAEIQIPVPSTAAPRPVPAAARPVPVASSEPAPRAEPPARPEPAPRAEPAPRPEPALRAEPAARPEPRPSLGPTLLDEPTLDAGDDDGRTRTITRQYDTVPVVRLVLAGFLVTMALVLTMKLLSGLVDRAAESGAAQAVAATAELVTPKPDDAEEAPEPEAEAEAPPPVEEPDDEDLAAAPTPGMRVHLRAHDRVKVAVDLDGTVAFDGWIEAGERHDFHGAERIAVEVSDLTRLTMAYNGDKVEPLGNLSHPRRLVFVADGG